MDETHLPNRTEGSRFRYIFFDFGDFLFVASIYYFLTREGLEMVRGWIPHYLDQISAQIDHSGPIWGPFVIVDFSKTHLGPK